MANEISVERRDGGVAVLTLNAGGRRNALTVDMAEELVAACDELDADHHVGAVVVRGEGGFFCAGGDRATLDAAGRDPADPEVYSGLSAVYRSFERVGLLQAPTIAAVRGGAVGAGLNLMLATDLRVVARDARLISGFLPIGLHPGGGHGALLGRTGAREAAAAMALFGEQLDGERAAALGLAWVAVDDGDVDADRGRARGARRQPTRSWHAARRPRSAPSSARPRSRGRPRSSWSAHPRCGRCAGRRSASPASAASRAFAVFQ